MQVKSFAALNAATPLQPFEISRRSLRPDDVLIAIDYCGVCHSDLHQARNEWGNSKYPMVPGHEIVGRIVETGAQVSRYKTGDLVGVGVIVDSCGTCPHCTQQYEQYCIEGPVGTYNALERDGKTITQGGYSAYIVVKEKFVLKVDEKLDAKAVAPLLCAGITTYSPLRYAGVQAGCKGGVIGRGGWGKLGGNFAVSFGAEVTVLSTSASKEPDARRLGAHHFVNTKEPGVLRKLRGSFDVLLDTVSAPHSFNPYLDLLGLNGKLLVVGLPAEDPNVSPFALITNRRSIVGSMIGSMQETQEMLDYCATHNIVADVELIAMQQINEAYERLEKNDVKYRFVIDMKTL